MGVLITSKEKQVSGVFNRGEILENKPIGFPQDGGAQKPFSNLFLDCILYLNNFSTIHRSA